MCDRRCGSSHRRHYSATAHTHRTAWRCCPCDSRPKGLVRLNACLPTVFAQCKLNCSTTSCNGKRFRGEFTISPGYGHHTHFCRTSNLYHRPVSSRLELSAPSTFVLTQRKVHQKKNSLSERCLNIVANSTHHPPTYVCDKA